MEPIIKTSIERKLAGKRIETSFARFSPAELWQSFMPFRKQITNNVNRGLISMAIYKPNFFNDFNPANEFEKWAATEVSDFENIPAGFEKYTLPEGLYAVFNYKGLSTDSSIFQYIFGTWLPKSDFDLDNRPHFEILGEKYKNNDPDSEEEIWIPVKRK